MKFRFKRGSSSVGGQFASASNKGKGTNMHHCFAIILRLHSDLHRRVYSYFIFDITFYFSTSTSTTSSSSCLRSPYNTGWSKLFSFNYNFLRRFVRRKDWGCCLLHRPRDPFWDFVETSIFLVLEIDLTWNFFFSFNYFKPRMFAQR